MLMWQGMPYEIANAALDRSAPGRGAARCTVVHNRVWEAGGGCHWAWPFGYESLRLPEGFERRRRMTRKKCKNDRHCTRVSPSPLHT